MSLKCDACRLGNHGGCSNPRDCGCEYMREIPHSVDALRARLEKAEKKLRAVNEELQKRRYTMLTLDSGEALIVDVKTWNKLLKAEKACGNPEAIHADLQQRGWLKLEMSHEQEVEELCKDIVRLQKLAGARKFCLEGLLECAHDDAKSLCIACKENIDVTLAGHDMREDEPKKE